MAMLEDRRSEVLRALVEEHIKTGEPVSSRAVLDRSRINVSAATVRNDLAALEHEGLVQQPHTSAGRVPTVAGYRYYVDHLGPGRLRHAAQAKIETLFGDVHVELSKLLKATSDLLAEITDLPSVVIAPGFARESVRSLHTVQITSDQVLVIVVTEGGRVVQQRGRVRVPVTATQIDEAQRLVAAAVVGTELGVTPDFGDEVKNNVSDPVREAVLTITDSLHLAGTSGSEMFLGGTQRMTQVWHDLSTVQRILEIMEREAEVIDLLAGQSGTSIQLGEDLDLAVISKVYESRGDAGTVGVIGPMRMNYKRAISAVEEVTRELEEQIGARSD
ncbi:MAG TPA: heat-inducible transcriptional repressor HrcA [Acidimicrobiia bacterium]|nr:heat-inducible transcriptional repressor HrcA [Acidimicrobiia bacterium]